MRKKLGNSNNFSNSSNPGNLCSKAALLLTCAALVLTMTACRSKPEITDEREELANIGISVQETSGYQEIYNEYSQKVKDLAPQLRDELAAEMEGLSQEEAAALCEEKVQALAAITNEGIEKMDAYLEEHGNQNTYTEWSTKLYDDYINQSDMIREVLQTTGEDEEL